jgi:hypothetical protein
MGKYAHIVGNGDSESNRSNAHTLDWGGLGWFAGGLKVGGTGQDDTDAKNVATEEYVDTAVAALVNSAPETLDTLGELATAFQENADMVATLDAAVTNKAEKSDLKDLADLVDTNTTTIESLQKQVLPTSLILADAITGESYTIQIQNGQLVSFKN